MTELAYKYDTQCELCGYTDTHELFGNARDPLLNVPDEFSIYSCRNCAEYLVTRAGFRVLRVACKNSVLHPTATLPTVYDFDIRLEWTKDGYSPLKAYPQFLLFSLLSIPNSIRRNLRNDNALMNLIAVKP